ncbi:ATP-binding cassette domain-containing protein, partial [Pseudomonas aeruginosa]|uniref:ABC transporter ATP-binding protein n=1 Tax=Pseudomonas aeruginosa TaxID=287 RepID=UPI0023AF080E
SMRSPAASGNACGSPWCWRRKPRCCCSTSQVGGQAVLGRQQCRATPWLTERHGYDPTSDALSGGQRQRVWIAMVLAQETPLLLLDEPTTYLDIVHQIELLELLAELNRQGRTIVAVLHDLNQACRYASHLIAMRDGAILAEGAPAHIFTERLVEEVFGLRSLIIADPVSGTPLLVPRGIAADAPG